jgi:hypothetical protein
MSVVISLAPNAQPGQANSWVGLTEEDSQIITGQFGHSTPTVYREWEFLRIARELGYSVWFRTDLEAMLPHTT